MQAKHDCTFDCLLWEDNDQINPPANELAINLGRNYVLELTGKVAYARGSDYITNGFITNAVGVYAFVRRLFAVSSLSCPDCSIVIK